MRQWEIYQWHFPHGNHPATDPNVRAAHLNGTQKDTAAKWEQGVRKPSGSALRLLEIAEKKPGVLIES